MLTNQRPLTNYLRHQYEILRLKRRRLSRETSLAVMKEEKQLYSQAILRKLFGKVTLKLPRLAAERIRVSV